MKAKRFFFALLCAVFLLILFPATVMAADGTQDGLTVTLTTDKNDYTSEETINATVLVANTNDFTVSGVQLQIILPDGIQPETSDIPNTIQLGAGESATFLCTAVSDAASAGAAAAQTAAATDQSTGNFSLGWWIASAVLACIAAVLIIFRKKLPEMPNRIFAVLVILILAISLVLSAIALVSEQVFANTYKTFSVSQSITVDGAPKTITAQITYPAFSGDSKTVSFETNGGSAVSEIKVPTGGKLTKLPTPMKADYSFTGWYADEALAKQFYSDVPIMSDTTLYASYVPTQTTIKQYEDPEKYVEDCEPDYTISIVSPAELTAENLTTYVQTTVYFGELPELNVSGSGGVYTIAPIAPYPAGGHFRFELLDETLSFEGETAAVRSLDFRIHKDPVNDVQLNDGIHYVLWSEINTLGEGAYYVPAALDIKKGDTVCFWDGEINEDARFYNVLLAATPKKVDGRNVSLVTVGESQFSDVLSGMDISFQQDVPMTDYMKGVDLDKLALSAKNSAGTRQMASVLAYAISKSPSFQSMMSKPSASNGAAALASTISAKNTLQYSGVFEPVEENDDKINLLPDEELIDGLTVTASVGSAQNYNFYNAGPDEWTVLTLTFTFDKTIKNKVNIKAVFTVKEYIKTTLQGNLQDGYDFIDFLSGKVPNFDLACNNYSQTDVALSVLIKTKDTSEDDYLDITKEIEELTKPGSEGGAATFLEEVLGAKGDYIDLVDQKLMSLMFQIDQLGILQFNIDLNFVVKVNFAAGISAQTTVMSARQVGVKHNEIDGLSTYDNTLPGDGRFSFDFYCAGYLGFKAGLKLSLSLSAFCLPSLGKVGVSGEVGAYLDIYGFLHLNISKPYQYIGLDKDGSFISYPVTYSLQGGVYMEVGIYLDLQVFAKSEVCKVKASASFLDKKWPLLELGDQYVLLRFINDGSAIIINEEQFPLYGSAGLLDAEYIDMKTGSVVTSSEIDMSKIMPNFSVQFSSPYLEYNDTDYTINVLKSNFGTQYENFPVVSPGTKRLDETIYVYYTGGNLAFSHQEGGDTMKQIDLTWIDSSIDIADYPDLDAVKATYVVDIGGEQQQIAEKYVPFGSIPGNIDYRAYVQNCSYTGITNDPTQPIYEDTVFTIQLKRYQRLVSYLTYHDGSWHFDVYAVNIGDVPVIPDGYDFPGPGLAFTGWVGTPGASAGNLGTANDVTAVDYDATYIYVDNNYYVSWWYPSGEYIYQDLDTTKPLYSTTGTYDECYSSYYSHLFQGTSLNKSSQYLYEAQYQGGPFTISLKYPAMSYNYCGQKINYNVTTYTYKADFNDMFSITNVIGYPGCELPVWDENGDGVADYPTFAQLPRVTKDVTLTAIVKHRTYTVTVLDIDDEIDETLTVNEGDLPAVIKTEPDYPDGDDYAFKYWAVSKAGGEFAEWNSGSDPGVFADWTIKPVYERVYDVTFDYAGGSYQGNSFETMKLEAGTYRVDELIDYYPAKAADVRNTYVFDDWSCGSSFTVAGDRTIIAEYTATPIIYTVEFNTAIGSFVSGDTYASYTGDYDNTQDFIDGFLAQNETLATVYTVDKVYTFEKWEKISLSATHDRYEAQWDWDYRNYTVTFDAGAGAFSNGSKTKTVTMPYGASGNLSAVSADIVTPEIEGYAYNHTGWKDQADQNYGLTDGFTVHGDTTFTATYEKGDRILYTVTLNANGGTFPGGETTKTYTGYYGENTNIIVGDPTRTGNATYNYVFDGWSASIPATFTETVTITAQWEQVYKDYTITFNANGGAFADSSTVKTQTYHYNDTIIPPDDPAKAEDADYTYEFTGWNPTLAPVTENCTYKATYRATLKAGLPATGIIVSDGMNSEDINCNGALVSGYTCALQDHSIPGGGTVQIPVLTITGNGLTFGGSNDSVYVVIDPGCSSVTFDGLALSGAYPYGTGILVAGEGTTDAITINISGDCELVNTSDRKCALWSLRPVVLSGQGTDPSLSISSIGTDALYSSSLVADSLTLSVIAATGSDPEVSTYAITGEGAGSDPVWRFVDSNVTARGIGAVGVSGSVVIEGDSHINLISTNNGKAALMAFGEDSMGYLRFVDFTGEFSASYQDTGATGPAVQTTTGITFAPDIADYDLGGADVVLYEVTFDGMDTYYTFAVDSGSGPVPEAQVHVTPGP